MGSDESHFNDSFINCEGLSHKTVSTDQRSRTADSEPVTWVAAWVAASAASAAYVETVQKVGVIKACWWHDVNSSRP